MNLNRLIGIVQNTLAANKEKLQLDNEYVVNLDEIEISGSLENLILIELKGYGDSLERIEMLIDTRKKQSISISKKLIKEKSINISLD